MFSNFPNTLSEVLRVCAIAEKLRITDKDLLTIRDDKILTPVGDIFPLLTKHKSSLKDHFVDINSLKILITNLTKIAAIVRLNHIGFCYKVDSQEIEKARLLGIVKNKSTNLYEESSNDNGMWFFLGNRDNWEDTMIELIPVESTNDRWKDYWLPHLHIDIDTTLSEKKLREHAKSAFGNAVKPFSIAIDGIVYIVRNRLGIIDGVNITIDLATNARNVKYQRLSLLKEKK